MNDSTALDPLDQDVTDLAGHASQGHAALMRGDLDTYLTHLTVSEDFTLMAPFGGPPTRGRLSSERWESVARFFRNGRDASLELVQAWRGADMAVLA